MALQGNLETFPIADVLRLLSSTAKTGRLRVEAAGGERSVWLADGTVVAVETAGGGPAAPVDVLFSLLRLQDGIFAFVTEDAAGEVVEEGSEPLDVEALLAEAEELLAEWTAVEAVVPSLDVWVSLVDELPSEAVTVDAPAWRTVTAIGSGAPVRDVGGWLELDELAACRAVRDLVEAGLAQISEPPEDLAAPAPGSGAAVVEPDDGNYVELPPIPLPDDLAPLPEAAPVTAAWTPFDEDRWDELEAEARAAQAAPPAGPAPAGEPVDEPVPVDEAVPVDDGVPVDEGDQPGDEEADEPDDALEEPEELRGPHFAGVEPIADEQPIDRSRLLRFLGSVRN